MSEVVVVIDLEQILVSSKFRDSYLYNVGERKIYSVGWW